MRTLFVAALALMVSACAQPILDRDIQLEADVACRAIGASLLALAPHRQELPESVEATVQRIRVESDPLCTGENPPRTMEVANQLTRLAFDLITVEREID